MHKPSENEEIQLEQGVVVLSLDIDLLWGRLDSRRLDPPDARRFAARHPHAVAALDHVLRSLCGSGVSATWLVVGGMALSGSDGAEDSRAHGLPRSWTRFIPSGNEITAPLWYRRAFVRQLANASVPQDVGLHGGLTDLIWTDRHSVPQVARAELEAGLSALSETGIHAGAFSFPRNRERHHSLLAEGGIRCYRGRTPILSEEPGSSFPGSVGQLLDELGWSAPPPVWPRQKLPGLWNIPASLFLYPVGARSRIVTPESRLERIQKGIEAAARHRGVFHFCLQPVRLAESPCGYRLFDSIVERLAHARQKGDIAILTMTQLAGRMDALTEQAGVHTSGAAALPGQMIGAGQY